MSKNGNSSRISLSILAGRSDQIIEIGEVLFEMAPITMAEYIDYQVKFGGDQEEKTPADTMLVAEWIAEKLRARVHNPTSRGVDPSIIDAVWVTKNIPMVMVGTIRYILLNGELPEKSNLGK